MRDREVVTARRMVEVYSRFLRRLGLLVVLLTSAGVASALVVYPLWYLSTANRIAYNLTFAVLFGLAVLAMAARRVVRLHKQRGGIHRFLVSSLMPRLARIIVIVVCVGLLYPLAWLFFVGSPFVGVAATVGYVLIVGLLASSGWLDRPAQRTERQ